jgi:hypothetical protein
MLAGMHGQFDQRSFLLQRAQSAMTGLIDGSLSTLAPIFAVAFAASLPDFTRAPNDQIWIARIPAGSEPTSAPIDASLRVPEVRASPHSGGSCGSRVSSACATTRTRRTTGAEIRASGLMRVKPG